MAAAAPDARYGLPADWRARLRSRLLRAPDHELTRCRFGAVDWADTAMGARLRATLPASLTAAAVLVPIVEDPREPQLLLTQRAGHLRRHAGQISFPGGSLEPGDADIAAAALRETEEEIGIHAAFIEPLGFLGDHLVQTGYRITPVVALLQPGFTLRPDRAEVAEVFELPLAFALQSANYRRQRRMLRELEVDVWDLPYADRNIWGATAGILAHLRDVVMAEGA
jgi:8-oxo-dGTP pyrophosphatase MutT (NUDIX family)